MYIPDPIKPWQRFAIWVAIVLIILLAGAKLIHGGWLFLLPILAWLQDDSDFSIVFKFKQWNKRRKVKKNILDD